MSKIGVIDSGVGGLTILKDVIKAYPNQEYVYLGDSLNCPYGVKTVEEIKEFSFNLVYYLVNNYNIDILIIACNSISSTATDYLKECFKKLEIIEVINPTADIVKDNKNSKIVGVIATSATINSNAYQDLLKNDYDVYGKAIPVFVKMVEDNNVDTSVVKNELQYLLDKNIDTLILGCTHFPLLKEDIEKYFKGKIITSSEGIIKKLSFLTNDENNKKNLKLLTTGDSKAFDYQLKYMFDMDEFSETVNIEIL